MISGREAGGAELAEGLTVEFDDNKEVVVAVAARGLATAGSPIVGPTAEHELPAPLLSMIDYWMSATPVIMPM
jgi:hypothetical protein